jgi:transposase
MRSYSQDLRDRVLKGLERGEGAKAIATRLEVSREWVYDVKRRFEKEGLRHSLRVGGHRKSCLVPIESEIRGRIKASPDLTLEELVERIGQRGIVIGPSGLWCQLKKWGLRFKKNPARERTGTGRRQGSARQMEGCAAHV